MPNLLQEPALNRTDFEARRRHWFKLVVFAVLISSATVLLAALLFKIHQSGASGDPSQLLTNSSSAATDP